MSGRQKVEAAPAEAKVRLMEAGTAAIARICGRRSGKPSTEIIDRVWALACAGIPARIIAELFGIPQKTLEYGMRAMASEGRSLRDARLEFLARQPNGEELAMLAPKSLDSVRMDLAKGFPREELAKLAGLPLAHVQAVMTGDFGNAPVPEEAVLEAVRRLRENDRIHDEAVARVRALIDQGGETPPAPLPPNADPDNVVLCEHLPLSQIAEEMDIKEGSLNRAVREHGYQPRDDRSTNLDAIVGLVDELVEHPAWKLDLSDACEYFVPRGPVSAPPKYDEGGRRITPRRTEAEKRHPQEVAFQRFKQRVAQAQSRARKTDKDQAVLRLMEHGKSLEAAIDAAYAKEFKDLAVKATEKGRDAAAAVAETRAALIVAVPERLPKVAAFLAREEEKALEAEDHEFAEAVLAIYQSDVEPRGGSLEEAMAILLPRERATDEEWDYLTGIVRKEHSKRHKQREIEARLADEDEAA